MRQRIAARPILAFIVLAFAFSYLVGLPFLAATAAWFPRLPTLWSIYLGRLLVVFGPAFAAIIVCAATAGRGGVWELLGRLRVRRAAAHWWIILPPLTLALTIAAHVMVGVPPAQIADAVLLSWPMLIGHYLLQTLVMGVGEEIGWRGWLLPALLRGRTRFAASSILAAIWGLWHLPILLSGFRSALAFAVAVLALAFLLTALWSRVEGSIALMALAHGSVNAPVYFLEGALGSERGQAAWEATVLLYAAGAVILIGVTWSWWWARIPDADPYGGKTKTYLHSVTRRIKEGHTG